MRVYKSRLPDFLGALLNSTIIDLVNNYTRDFLFSYICPKQPDPIKEELNIQTTIFGISFAFIFFFIILSQWSSQSKFIYININ